MPKNDFCHQERLGTLGVTPDDALVASMISPHMPASRRQLPILSLEEAREAAAYARGSRAAFTWRAYEADWHAFESWCRAVKLAPLPSTAHTVALYLSAEAKAGRAPSTLGRLSALGTRRA